MVFFLISVVNYWAGALLLTFDEFLKLSFVVAVIIFPLFKTHFVGSRMWPKFAIRGAFIIGSTISTTNWSQISNELADSRRK